MCNDINATLKKCKKVNKGNDVTYIVDEDDSIEIYKKFYTLCFLRIAGEKNFKEYLSISELFVSKDDKKEISADCDERINEIVTLLK